MKEKQRAKTLGKKIPCSVDGRVFESLTEALRSVGEMRPLSDEPIKANYEAYKRDGLKWHKVNKGISSGNEFAFNGHNYRAIF
jgi:hypothetical protein